MKGIILAGGNATRLYPVTKSLNKQLLPIYDKPMIYYPLSVLLLAGIKDILIISAPEQVPLFEKLLGDGSDMGVSFSYAIQESPKGLADAFIVGSDFIGDDSVCLILGDNVFFGPGLSEALDKLTDFTDGASIFGYYTKNPERFGVLEFDENQKVLSIEEKPQKPKSNWVIPGIYCFDNHVVEVAKNLKPSPRGEIEITEVIAHYHKNDQLKLSLLGRGYAWLDTGTHSSLLEAGMFIKTIEDRQGLKIGCIEEVAYRQGFMSKDQLKAKIDEVDQDYANYLSSILNEKKYLL